ncbi:SDR family NAD(P)-dependent oxidoreductase, partial [Bosea sp. CER48]|uniref:SDR family NAD(P)-dependent oxidoreductase n=1 Tax=Bosea sp. CER48 TaxID=3377035 RepID=UPI00381290DC
MAEVALVTGGARRIGRAIVARLARAGYAVAIHHGDSRVDAEALAGELRDTGARCCTLAADLADAEAATGLIPAAADALG